MKKITDKDLPIVASCKIQCVYRQNGICRSVKVNRKNSDALCSNLTPHQLLRFLNTDLSRIKVIEIDEQQELVLELVSKGIRLNYLEHIEIDKLIEQLKIQDYKNF